MARVEAHIICFNESDILAMVIKHYRQFCERIIIYDNFSTDDSHAIATSMGCEVLKFGISGKLDDIEYLKIKNHCWKNSDADYVIVCDADEILTHSIFFDQPYIPGESPTIIKTYGWQIYSNEMPKKDLFEVTQGWPFKNYSKLVMFSPQALTEINYEPGCHECNPIGDIQYSTLAIPLFHYKHIGGVERLIKRNALFKKRMSFNNRKNGFGIHYLDSELKTRKEWIENLAKARPFTRPTA